MTSPVFEFPWMNNNPNVMEEIQVEAAEMLKSKYVKMYRRMVLLLSVNATMSLWLIYMFGFDAKFQAFAMKSSADQWLAHYMTMLGFGGTIMCLVAAQHSLHLLKRERSASTKQLKRYHGFEFEQIVQSILRKRGMKPMVSNRTHRNIGDLT